MRPILSRLASRRLLRLGFIGWSFFREADAQQPVVGREVDLGQGEEEGVRRVLQGRERRGGALPTSVSFLQDDALDVVGAVGFVGRGVRDGIDDVLAPVVIDQGEDATQVPVERDLSVGETLEVVTGQAAARSSMRHRGPGRKCLALRTSESLTS